MSVQYKRMLPYCQTSVGESPNREGEDCRTQYQGLSQGGGYTSLVARKQSSKQAHPPSQYIIWLNWALPMQDSYLHFRTKEPCEASHRGREEGIVLLPARQPQLSTTHHLC